MFSLFQRDFPGIGSVYYRGNLPPRAEEFSFLERQGFSVKPGPNDAGVHWMLRLSHPKLGEAELVALRDFKPPPKVLIDQAFSLSDQEKAEAAAAGTGVTLKLPATRKNMLRDRKRFLYFLRAVMADDGVVAADHTSSIFWSPAALKDETSHSADVDISALYCLHAVTPDGGGLAYWLHTHGLAEIGAVDFDVLKPSEDLLSISGADAVRALAFAVVEGRLKPGGPGFRLFSGGGSGEVRLVDASKFDSAAPSEESELRDRDVHHYENRGVVCDPSKGFFGFGRSVRASRRLSGPLDERTLVNFSTAATELAAERARNTLPLLKKLMAEFAELELPALAKIGYATDAGGGAREHLWFSIHEIGESEINATLESSPFRIARMKAGQRAWHPIEQLSDWGIMTPVGAMNPRDLRAARVIRERFDEVREAVRGARSG
jgi:hypothetical protein